MNRSLVLMAALLSFASTASAQQQLKPFVGVTFLGHTTYVGDLEKAAGTPNVIFGGSYARLGEVFGLEGEVAHAPGFFDRGSNFLVTKSSLTTVFGNVLIAVPRRASTYTLRPFAVGGLGMIHSRTVTFANTLALSRSIVSLDVGGGVTGPLSDSTGVSWDLRYFRSIGPGNKSLTVGAQNEEIGFWRATGAFVFFF